MALKQNKGLSIVLCDLPNDKRDGWLDVQTNAVVINVGHPLYVKFENYATTLEWHYARDHSREHIVWMKNTPTGKSAMVNKGLIPYKFNLDSSGTTVFEI